MQGGTYNQQGAVGQLLGIKANTPQNNTQQPRTTLSQNQVAPLDLSSRYANVGGTIYDTQGQQKFSNPTDFFTHAQQNGFKVSPGNWNIKWNTSYKPTGKETIYGQTPGQAGSNGMAQNTAQTQTPSTGQNNASSGVSGNTSNVQTNQNPQNNTNTDNGQYTPPNKGTTGVSEGGIIGNLINTAQQYDSKIQDVQNQIAGLQASEASEIRDLQGGGTDLGLATGQSAAVENKYSARINALGGILNTLIQQRQQNIDAMKAAGALNAPQFAQPGTVQVSPSQPNPGATTSGAANLNSLIGTRNVPGQTQTEYYNTSTGQGFSNPQQLADFVNQQVPGANVNAGNVFQYLQQNGQGGSNILGGGSNFMEQYAQDLASGQVDAIPSDVKNNMALWAQVQQRAKEINPNYNYNVASGTGVAQQSNVQTGGTAATNANAQIYQKALSDYQDLQTNISNIYDFGQQIIGNMPRGINPTDSTVLNSTIQDFLNKFASNPQYSKLATNVQGFQARVSALLNTGEIPSAATAGAQAIANGSLPLKSMAATIQQIESEAGVMLQNQQTKVQNAYGAMNSGTNSGTAGVNTSGNTNGNWGWNGQ